MPTLLTYLLFTLTLTSFAHKVSDWRSRSIYQLLTDRFSKTNGDTSPCANISNYCGGTFKGIINNLDYISGMGFDAIWISPVVANTPGGYHGYWAQNIFEINSEYGTADELRQLIDACHAKDIWVMVDVVGNHMGNMLVDGDFTDKIPFNDSSYYHSNTDCSVIDTKNDDLLQTCWLAQLPDLNQDHHFVRETLLKWITDLVATYNIDGIRIDTVPYVAKHFWKSFTDAAGVYSLGEVFDARLPYDAGYVGPVDGVLNYPLFFALRSVFHANGSMDYLRDYYLDSATAWPDTEVLGNFVDNHDNARFLNDSNKIAFKSALAFSLTAIGIPITYYGSEQEFSGGNDPANREALWGSMDRNSEIYGFLKRINAFRKEHEIYKYPQIERLADDSFYAFSRGKAFFAFTNSPNNTKRTVTDHSYEDGTILCNALRQGDCVTIRDGKFEIRLLDGEVKMYAPRAEKKQREFLKKAEDAVKYSKLIEKIGLSQVKPKSRITDEIRALGQISFNMQGRKKRGFRGVKAAPVKDYKKI